MCAEKKTPRSLLKHKHIILNLFHPLVVHPRLHFIDSNFLFDEAYIECSLLTARDIVGPVFQSGRPLTKVHSCWDNDYLFFQHTLNNTIQENPVYLRHVVTLKICCIYPWKVRILLHHCSYYLCLLLTRRLGPTLWPSLWTSISGLHLVTSNLSECNYTDLQKNLFSLITFMKYLNQNRLYTPIITSFREILAFRKNWPFTWWMLTCPFSNSSVFICCLVMTLLQNRV